MSALFTVFVFVFPLMAIFAAVYSALRTMRKTGSPKRAWTRHFITLALAIVIFCAFSVIASADTAEEAAAAADSSGSALGALAAAASVGLAGVAAAIAIAASAPAAIGALAEDPKSFGKAIVFVAMGEAIALYGFIVALIILLF